MKTIFAILLMCFTSFAFAQDVMEVSKKAREEGSVPNTSVFCCEGGMAPPHEPAPPGEMGGEPHTWSPEDEGEGELGQDPGAMGDEGEEQPE